jgi:hypothetical protein
VPEAPVLKVEYCCSTRSAPQRGQAGGCWLRPRTSFSNIFPHFWQVYSKMGMLAQLKTEFQAFRCRRFSSPTGMVSAGLR